MATQSDYRLIGGNHDTVADCQDSSNGEIVISLQTKPSVDVPDTAGKGMVPFKIKAYKGGAANVSTFRKSEHAAGDTLFMIMLWFASNIGIVLLNKIILGNFGFGYPIFLTECHMLACTLLSEAGKHSGLMRPAPVQSPWHLIKIATLAAAFLSSVVLNNVAIKFIPVSFVEEIGALTPAATAALAFLLMGTLEGWQTYAALIPVMLGIVLATGYELSFNSIGFTAAVGGCLARALKTVLQALLLSSQDESMDSMSLLRLMAPIAALMLLPAIALLEPGVLGAVYKLLKTQPAFGMLLLANSSLAFIVNYTNFKITKVTSALTLQVLGCAKGVLATFTSLFLFGNQISGLGVMGYGITVAGVLGYGLSKHWASPTQPESLASGSWSQKPISTGSSREPETYSVLSDSDSRGERKEPYLKPAW